MLFGVTDVGNMSDVGATGDSQNAYNAGSTIGTYLNTLGFNMDFAPVADVLTNPDNTVIKDRSFGSDSQLVADMVCAEMQGLNEHQILSVVKTFSGTRELQKGIPMTGQFLQISLWMTCWQMSLFHSSRQ